MQKAIDLPIATIDVPPVVQSSSKKNISAEADQVWSFFNKRPNGFFVEVGANDPEYRSQTWLLEQKGWKGVLIEPQAKHFKNLCEKRPNSKVYAVACASPESVGEGTLHIAASDGYSSLSATQAEATYIAQEKIQIRTLNQILEEMGSPLVDFVSIDVEGHQLEVLRGFSLKRYHPSLLLVEDRFRDGWATHLHMLRNGYRIIRRTDGLNSWYVPKDKLHHICFSQKLSLFRFVWLGTPFRILKFWWKNKKQS